MRILHTSDWHLGHALYDYDRKEEQQNFLDQLVDIVEEKCPDVLLLCGDIYDRTTPPIPAREMYVRTMLNLHDRCPNLHIAVAAGNHDGKSALEVESLLWDRLNVKLVGQIERNEDGSVDFNRHIWEIKDADGNAQGFIILVPHIYDSSYPQVDGAATKEERQRIFFQSLLNETANRNTQGLPVVLTAHLSMTGCNFAGHETMESIGKIETIDQSQLGTGYDYLALGHIHNAKTFTNSGQLARYCGTPIAISFDEVGRHGVSLVTIEKGQDPVVEEIPIENSRPLLTIPSDPKPFDEALQELKEFPNSSPAYIRLNVLLTGSLPANYLEQIVQVLKDKEAKYCCVKTSTKGISEDQKSNLKVETIEADNMPSPLDLAEYYYQQKNNVPLDPDLRTLLEQAIQDAQSLRNNE